jgi:peroxiredoxin family protein
MAGRVVFFLQQASFEAAFQGASLAITAAAMGDEVHVVVAFDALRNLVRGSFGNPQSEREQLESARADGLGVPAPVKMLDEARKMGAKLVACDTTVKLCGISTEEALRVLDEVLGLASIWRLTEGARTLSL